MRPAWVACTAIVCAASYAQDARDADDPSPQITALGNDRFQIGAIVVDKSDGSFVAPGRVLRIEPPLEYVAVTLGGAKGYESLLELDVSAIEFNVACILIGLTNDDVSLPEYQFDSNPVLGPRVRITALIQKGGDTMEVGIAELLLTDGQADVTDDWVYIGSQYAPGRPDIYMAEEVGTLIGFVHDPASIIEHSAGVGIGAYGSIGGNGELLDDEGMELALKIKVIDPHVID